MPVLNVCDIQLLFLLRVPSLIGDSNLGITSEVLENPVS